MQINTPVVTLHGKPIVLLGIPLEVGMVAPDFRVVDGDFHPVTLSSGKGRIMLISAVPSLDTPICMLQTKRFNEEAARLPANVTVFTISADLPFAQKRISEAEKITGIQVLSDCVWHEFGAKFGIRIKDMGLLTRSIWIVTTDGHIAYRQIVPEITTHPDYDAALQAVRELASKH